MGDQRRLWVDEATHTLHFGGQTFPCDRDIETALPWKNHALLLSSDTDCLSLWDRDGLVRLTRVGVYPQDMAIRRDTAVVCGGADGRLHLLTLPELLPLAEYPVPGMPERICLHGDTAWMLNMLPEPEVHTMLLAIDLTSGVYAEVTCFAGLPGAIAAHDTGLWLSVNEQVLHLPYGAATADMVITGFGLARRMIVQEDRVLITDPLEGMVAQITQKPRPAIEVLHRGNIGQIVFI